MAKLDDPELPTGVSAGLRMLVWAEVPAVRLGAACLLLPFDDSTGAEVRLATGLITGWLVELGSSLLSSRS